MLPQLRRLEETFPDVVVIGVHSPKFTAERDSANVRAAALAFGVEHPVVSDPDHRVWDSYAVKAWPTLVFVSPNGRVIGQHAGELRFPQLGDVTEVLLHQLRDAGLFGDEPASPLSPRPEPMPTGTLAFPDTVLVDQECGRLIVSDTGHHRVVVARMDGRVRRAFGRGVAGFSNGDGQAAFRAPRGLALAGDVLYVADTENHALRAIDLADGTVHTIAGTREQATLPGRGGPARETPLSSPWDLALSADGSALFVAMAGFHQVWALDLASGMIGPYSGTGHEGIKDAERGRAWHAQPSGLSREGDTLYVADSETSAVRAIETVGAAGGVRTLVGRGLFEFGDRDGPGDEARLQHPLGLHASGAAMWVADSYNNRIRKIDIPSGEVNTVAGNGEHGLQDGAGEAARLWEPSGLAAVGDTLYIADTNNHAVRTLDTRTRELTTLRMTE